MMFSKQRTTSYLADATNSAFGRSWDIGSGSCVILHSSGSLADDGYRSRHMERFNGQLKSGRGS